MHRSSLGRLREKVLGTLKLWLAPYGAARASSFGRNLIRDDELLDRIDEIVPPGVDVAPLEGAAYSPPWITQAPLRRRPMAAAA